ncbi:MAG TPA: carboxypeptidase regulatory-like domain-containing protein [Candidatus Acidoferrales bacterium]|nr:carboxypeptidase regulatory-like domain-containing protein [Candidatus Acidoferrales bacterium]
MNSRHASAACALAVTLAVVFGQVRDTTTGQPLPNVGVTIGSHHATTDARGNYRLSGIAPGTYTLSVKSDDVPPQHEHLTVGTGSMQFDFRVCSTTLDYGCGGAAPGPG